MAAQSKAQLLTEVHTLLKKHYKLETREERMSVLEAVVYGICHEGTTREQANQALSRFKDSFYDWNEVRVSSVEEIQNVLVGLPEPEGRAFRIRRFLRQLFEKTYGFALEGLGKKPLKDATKILQEYEAFQSDYVLATVIQQSLGGHAIPVDAPLRRGLERLHVADASTDDATLRSAIERAVPKNRGSDFVDLMEELTHDTCVEGMPDCPRCDLKKICPTGQTRLVEMKASEKASAKAEKDAIKIASKAPKDTPKAAPPKDEAPAATNIVAKSKPAAAKAKPKASEPKVTAPTPKAKSKPTTAPPKGKSSPPKGKSPRSK
jgi:endonuclease III